MTLPFWSSYLLRVFAWKIILGYKGAINASFMGLGWLEKPLEFLLYSPTAVVITLTHAWAAFAILPIYVSLEKIDRSLLEAATDLGDGPIKRFIGGHPPPLPAGGHRGLPADLHSHRRGLRDSGPGGRSRRSDDCQSHPGPVRPGQQLADGSGAVAVP